MLEQIELKPRMPVYYTVRLDRRGVNYRLRVPLEAIGFFFEDLLDQYEKISKIAGFYSQIPFSFILDIIRYSKHAVIPTTPDGTFRIPLLYLSVDPPGLQDGYMELRMDSDGFCCTFPRNFVIGIAGDLHVIQRNALGNPSLYRLWTDLMSMIQGSVNSMTWHLLAPLPDVIERVQDISPKG